MLTGISASCMVTTLFSNLFHFKPLMHLDQRHMCRCSNITVLPHPRLHTPLSTLSPPYPHPHTLTQHTHTLLSHAHYTASHALSHAHATASEFLSTLAALSNSPARAARVERNSEAVEWA